MKTNSKNKNKRASKIVEIPVTLRIPMNSVDFSAHGKELAMDLIRHLPLTLGGVSVSVTIRQT